VALLSAADAEWPLAEAARKPPPSTGAGEGWQQSGADATLPLSGPGRRDALAEAIASPSDLRSRIGRVAGPLAEIEPDLVLIFGGAFSLAGFPPWVVRSAELFEAGPLEAVTGSRLDAILRRYKGTRQRFGR
jgi:undecaprenyl pyrophosphate synthase